MNSYRFRVVGDLAGDLTRPRRMPNGAQPGVSTQEVPLGARPPAAQTCLIDVVGHSSAALDRLFSGATTGKLVVHLADRSTAALAG